jgi:hypothetical protein
MTRAFRLLRFMNDQLKVANNLIAKFNLKTITIKHLIAQTKKQIKQQEDRGESLSPIDFVKLGIENRYLTAENERNQLALNLLIKRNGK